MSEGWRLHKHLGLGNLSISTSIDIQVYDIICILKKK